AGTAKRWPNEQKPHTRRSHRARRQYSSKPKTCTEGADVDAVGISVKVSVHYPGRSVRLPCATATERCRDGRAEVSRGHIRPCDPAEGPNILVRMEPIFRE